jgi:H+/Cl- antiporter ClcA
MEAYRQLNGWIWDNSFVSSHRWMYLVLAMIFSLIVGLGVRYFHAPTAESDSWVDAFRGGAGHRPTWSRLPAAVVNSLASLLSGASVGPEGPIGVLSMQIADGYNRLRRLVGDRAENTALAGAASAFNGLLESPVFSAVLASELGADRQVFSRRLPALLFAGAIGYFVFWIVGSKGFGGYLGLSQVEDFKAVYFVYVVAFACVGLVIAILTGVLFRLAGTLFQRLEGVIVLRALIGGAITGATGYFVAIEDFSGEAQIFTLINEAAGYSTIELVGIAFLKLALLSVAFKTGFMGGPLFPSIFAATAVALAINSVFSDIPLIVIIGGIAGAQIVALMKAPFMTILFVGFFLSANQNLVALIVVSVTIGILVAPVLEAAISRRQRQSRP